MKKKIEVYRQDIVFISSFEIDTELEDGHYRYPEFERDYPDDYSEISEAIANADDYNSSIEESDEFFFIKTIE